MVYSNSEELLAIANLFNIKINIFSYHGKEGNWNQVCPDPIMATSAEVKFGKWAPDMSLYHSLDTHYDLLLSDNSRVALLGLLGKADEKAFGEIEDDWETVKTHRQHVSKRNETEEERLLTGDDIIAILETTAGMSMRKI